MTPLNPFTVPGTYICLLADVVSRWDISTAQLLEGTEITPSQLQEPIWHVSAKTAAQIIRRAVELTQEPGLGFHIGMQMTITCHGLLGFAAMIAKDIRDALGIAQEFIRLQSSVLEIRLDIQGGVAHLYFKQSKEFPLGEVFTFALLLGFAQMGKAITGQTMYGSADVEFKMPDYFQQFESLLPGRVSFEQPYTRLSFSANYLDLPLIMADPLAARLAREQCKRELHLLFEKSDITALVKELVYDEVEGFSSTEEVADKLNISRRTLQRKLAEAGKSFREVLEEVKLKIAVNMLENKNISMENIADYLGYTDVANFSRAFKRWTGQSPGKYRH